MSIYWLLLGITAVFAYFFGSMDTMVLASNFVFHRNLKRLGDHSRWLSNFRRLFGISGFFKLLAVEMYRFRGSHASVAMIVAASTAASSVGIAAAVVTAGVIALTRYLSLGTLAGMVVYVMVAVLAVDDALLLRLALLTAALILVKHIPAIVRLFRGTEPRLSWKEDITYKLDE